MKLTSITLIAAALAAIAGSVIAAPHPIDGQRPWQSRPVAAHTPAARAANEEPEQLPAYQGHEPPPYEDPPAYPQQERPPPTSGTIQATVDESRLQDQAARHEQAMNVHLLATEHLARFPGPMTLRAREHLRRADAHRVMLQHLHAARMLNERRNGNQAQGSQRRPFSRP